MNKKTYSRQLTHSSVSIFLVSMFMTPAASAAWGYEPFVTATGFFNDNLRFVSDNTESTLGSTVEAGVSLQSQFGVTEFRLTPKVRGNVYFSDSDLNGVEAEVTGSLSNKGPRSRLGLDITLANESSLTTELQDTGIVSASAMSQRIRLTPIWEYALSPRNSVQLGYGFNDVTWKDQENTALNDNSSGDAFVTFKRRLTERVDGTIRASRGEFSSSDTNYESITNNVEASVLTRFNERTSATVLLGAWNATVDNASSKEDSSGVLASAEWMHSTETSDHKATLAQSVVPSSAGQIREDLRVIFDNRLRVNQKLSAGFNVYIQNSQQVTSLSTESERSYFSLAPYIDWRLTSELTLTGRLAHAKQTIKRSTGDADTARNEIGFSVTYRKPRVTVY